MKQCLAVTARKRGGHRCTKEAVYGGCLCKIHARQLSSAGTGWNYRKIMRINMKNIDPNDLMIAIEEYRNDIGPLHPRPDIVGAYDYAVLELLSDGHEYSTDVIRETIKKVSGKSYNNSKVGVMMGQMKARGSVISRISTQDGRTVTLWSSFVKM